MHVSRGNLICAFSLTILAACGAAAGGDSQEAAPPAAEAAEAPSAAGTYTVFTIDDQGLPYAAEADGVTYEILGSTLVLEPDGSWREGGQVRISPADSEEAIVAEVRSTGTYSANGNTLTFQTTEARVPTMDGNETLLTSPESLPPAYAGTIQDGVIVANVPAYSTSPAMRVTYRQQ